MSNGELESYIELAERYYASLTEWCDSQGKSDLYINSGKVYTLQLKVNLIPSLNHVVYGLRRDNHIMEAARLEDAIANARQAVDDYDNGNILGHQLIERVLCVIGELEALCRPTAHKKPAETRQGNKAINKPNSKNRKILGDKFEVGGLEINYKNLWHRINNWLCVVKRIKAIRNFIECKLKKLKK